MISPIRLALACLLLVGATPSRAQETNPKLPAGRDPGGIAVALVTTGLDYTHPEVAPRLARDGEGELIGWDFVDNDNRPFAASASPTGAAAETGSRPDGTALARQLLAVYARTRLVSVRVRPDDPNGFAQAVAFVSRTPARILAVPFASGTRADWEPFRQAAERLGKNILFVLASGAEGAPADAELWPAAFRLTHAIAVAPAASANLSGVTPVDARIAPRGSSLFGARGQAAPTPAEAVALAAGLAACAQHREQASDPAAARRALLALGTPGTDGVLALDPVCLYGGQRF